MFCLLLRRSHTSARHGTSKGCYHDPKGLRDELRVEKPSVGALPEEERRRREERNESGERLKHLLSKGGGRRSICRCQPFLHENSANHRGSLLDLKKQMPHHAPTT